MHNGRRPIRGRAFYEKLRFDEAGQPLVKTSMGYLIPTPMEIPPIEIHHMESPSCLNPLGVKGVGEGGAIPARSRPLPSPAPSRTRWNPSARASATTPSIPLPSSR